jgi:hypothetical protein
MAWDLAAAYRVLPFCEGEAVQPWGEVFGWLSFGSN